MESRQDKDGLFTMPELISLPKEYQDYPNNGLSARMVALSAIGQLVRTFLRGSIPKRTNRTIENSAYAMAAIQTKYLEKMKAESKKGVM